MQAAATLSSSTWEHALGLVYAGLIDRVDEQEPYGPGHAAVPAQTPCKQVPFCSVQSWHRVPLFPQFLLSSVPCTQTPSALQHPGQVFGSQTLPPSYGVTPHVPPPQGDDKHWPPGGHETQVWPWLPQDIWLRPNSQIAGNTLLLQQPLQFHGPQSVVVPVHS